MPWAQIQKCKNIWEKRRCGAKIEEKAQKNVKNPLENNLRTADFWDLGMVLFEFLAKIIVEKHYLAGVGLRFKKF